MKSGRSSPCELSRHHRRIPAIGAGGGRRGFVADAARAAAGAAVGPHGGPVCSPVLPQAGGTPCVSVSGGSGLLRVRCLGRLVRSCRLLLLLSIKRLDLGYVVTGAAILALQSARYAGEVQRAGTAGALIVGDLCWHLIPSLPVPAFRLRKWMAATPEAVYGMVAWIGRLCAATPAGDLAEPVPRRLALLPPPRGGAADRIGLPLGFSPYGPWGRWGTLCSQICFYWNFMLLRMMSGMVPGTQSSFTRPMERARFSSICATYSIQS